MSTRKRPGKEALQEACQRRGISLTEENEPLDPPDSMVVNRRHAIMVPDATKKQPEIPALARVERTLSYIWGKQMPCKYIMVESSVILL
ncbi:MAG: hypothetical protein ACQEQN_01425 [Thermodesulfobacteriota bacterium]